MQALADIDLLRQYCDQNSEPAFAELVRRHINLVYSAAWRKTGNPHAAEEITQAVFIILARKAHALHRETMISGWLYQTTRLTAANHLRNEIRRSQREQEAYMRSLSNETEVWSRIEPLLEDALGWLNEKERNAVVLRFFEGKSFSEIGTAFGGSENAAKKRTLRAVEKLRKFFSRRGVALSAAALTAAISANSVQAAPVVLAKTVTVMAVTKGATAGGPTLTLIKGALKLMAWTKMKMAVAVGVGILFAAGTATVTVEEIAAHWTPGWQKSFDLSVLDRLPPQVKIRPSLPATIQSGFHRLDGRNGKALGFGQTVPDLLMDAYNVIPSRMIFNIPIPQEKYDLLDTYPTVPEFMKAMQKEIKPSLGLTVRHVLIETNVLILTVRSPHAPGLKPSTGAFFNPEETNSYSLRGAGLYYLVFKLENSLGTVVLNETRLYGRYDIDLKWDSTPEGLKRALHDQLGLELTPARKIVDYVVIDKAN